MEKIKELARLERPREKLMYQGAQTLSDEELFAILLGSGTPNYPLHEICGNLVKHELQAIAQMDLKALCAFKGIGPAKATILLAAAEYCRRANDSRTMVGDEQACYEILRPLLARASHLQYIVLLVSSRRELLAFSEVGIVLPDITKITQLAIGAGAKGVLLARNGWPAFSSAESRYLYELQAACAALGILCEGFMAVGPERFKMI